MSIFFAFTGIKLEVSMKTVVQEWKGKKMKKNGDFSNS